MLVFFIIFITVATSQEIPTPASLIAPRNFNYHPYQVQFLKENNIEPTKQGPVLFPNDGPPPPKPPLVVTSRPLIESIARSDLSDNTTTAASNPNKITIYDQNFAKNPENIYDQTLFGNDFANNVEYQASTYNGIPYADVLKNLRVNDFGRNDYNDYGERTVLPPIYKALEDHANQNVLDLKKKRLNHYNEPKYVDYTNQYENNDVSNDNHNLYDDDQNQNYAFSYTVRDQKTGDDFSHSQQSSGSATNGEYRVRLPDGRTQIVSYTADENGYKANVRYDDLKTDNNDYYNINNYKNNINNNNNNNIDKNNLNNYNSNPNDYNNINNNYNNNPNNYNSNLNSFNNRLLNSNYNANNNYNNQKQTIPVHEDSDYNSKEYFDYSSEYNNNNYQPYKTKFSFNPVTTTVVVPTVRPSYDEIKDLFTQRITSTPVYTDLLVGSNNHEVKYDSTTDKVVLIGNKNTYNSLITQKQQSFVGSTPASYLASTIASLRDRIAAKPVLSNSFINRINKYISLK